MSLLKSISEGLKSLTASPERTLTSSVKQPTNFVVNYEAGGELMHKHEELWKRLYQDTEETAKKAEDLDIEVGKLFVSCDKQSELLGKLHEEAAGLPILLNQLQDITNALADVEELYDQVEAALVQLENVCEEQEFVRNQLSHHKQLAVYKMKKEHELQRYRAMLAREHAAKVDQINKKKQNLLKEKQSAYEEQFTQDLDYYKKHGKIEKTKSDTETEVLSDGEGPDIKITGEITSPSETDVPSVASPEETEPTASAPEEKIETGDSAQSHSASNDQDSKTESGGTTD